MVNSGKKGCFTWLFRKMYELARENNLEFQLADTWAHSLQVWSIACELLGEILPKRTDIDVDFIEFACFVHDIGRMVTGSRASEEKYPDHGFSHGPIGAATLRQTGFFNGLPTFSSFGQYRDCGNLQEALARVCERHTGCVGISKANYPLDHGFLKEPKWEKKAGIEGVFVSTLEEKVVGIADFLTKAKEVYPDQGNGQALFFQGRLMPIEERLEETKDWDTFSVIKDVIREMQKLAPNFLDVNWDNFP